MSEGGKSLTQQLLDELEQHEADQKREREEEFERWVVDSVRWIADELKLSTDQVSVVSRKLAKLSYDDELCLALDGSHLLRLVDALQEHAAAKPRVEWIDTCVQEGCLERRGPAGTPMSVTRLTLARMVRRSTWRCSQHTDQN